MGSGVDVDEEVNLGPGVPTQTVRKFLEGQYGYKYSFLPYACVILIGETAIGHAPSYPCVSILKGSHCL